MKKEEILRKHLESKKGLAFTLNEELDLIRDAALNAMEEYKNSTDKEQPKEQGEEVESLKAEKTNLEIDNEGLNWAIRQLRDKSRPSHKTYTEQDYIKRIDKNQNRILEIVKILRTHTNKEPLLSNKKSVSDEEIKKEAVKQFGNSLHHSGNRNAFIRGAKFYREQLNK